MALVAPVCLAAPVALSYAVEALRPIPRRPERLAWAPHLAVRYAEAGGVPAATA